jgi:hypothetical protein
MTVNPTDIEEAKMLRAAGVSRPTKQLTSQILPEAETTINLRRLRDVVAQWGNHDVPNEEEVFRTIAIINDIKVDDNDNPTYTACVNKDRCRKKVT